MARILFVENSLRTDKLGILYLSAVLKERGHQTDLLQFSGEEDPFACIMSFKPDFIMYSLMTGEHAWFMQTNRLLKKCFNFVSVFGGPHPTFFPEFFEQDEDVDHVVLGPAESVIAGLVESRPVQKVVRGSLPELLDDLPFPDRTILYKYPEFGGSGIRRFIGSRDCRNACSYCFNHLFHRMYKDQKCLFFLKTSPARLVDEILDVRQKFGLEMTYMNDDNLAEDSDWLRDFCREYADRVFKPLGIPFCGSVRADSASTDLLETMASAGCSFLNIALESSVPETQRLLRRGRITNEDIRRACSDCKRFEIKVRLQNMIGLPVDDPLEDALLTFEFNKELGPYDSWASIFQPFPKTDLWRHCIESRMLDEGRECLNFYDDTILNIRDAEKINALHKWWHFAVRYQVPRGFLELMLEVPLTQEQKRLIQDIRWGRSAGELYVGGKK
jgi:radical SAM superfamily enzyme YgiQ (UPF0313 family)